ncbi:MAG TPA: hypothetical protein VGR62_11595 [Candidatus Binatia bacterium]|jgi:hypothetical protein|nr:hypothetical protein [Candidatus Binatia bacterium]
MTTRWLSALVLVTLAATSASGVVLCRSKRGPINVREVCRKRETPLSVDALGVTGVPGPSGAQGPIGTAAAVLVDANGVEVGPLLSGSATGSNNQVCFAALFSHPSLAGPVLLAVTGDGRIGNIVSYESTDCTGTAYVEFTGWLPILHGVQDTIYVPGESVPGTVHLQSFEYSDPQNTTTGCPVVTARGSCCATIDSVRSVLTTTTTSYTALGLTPPFRAVTK